MRLYFTSLLRNVHQKVSMGESVKTAVVKRVDIIKSAGDARNYRGLELSNHMKVLLVSDPTTDKSAAAMDVNIGENLGKGGLVPLLNCVT